MRILGIDPGFAIVGCGIVDYTGNRFSVVDYRAITTKAGGKLEDSTVMLGCTVVEFNYTFLIFSPNFSKEWFVSNYS